MCPPRPASDAGGPTSERRLWVVAAAHLDSVLAAVTSRDLARPTPCRAWCVADLLLHLEDGLRALAEATSGRMAATPAPAPTRCGPDRVRAALEAALGAALGRWSDDVLGAGSAPGTGVVIGRPTEAEIGGSGPPLPPWLLLTTGAVEATVHAWDLARGIGLDAPIPVELALPLRPAAELLADWSGPRGVPGGAFALPVPTHPGASAEERLLGVVGRRWSGPVGTASPIPGTRPISGS